MVARFFPRLAVILLPGALVVARANSRPGAQMCRRGEPAHVYACLRQNDLRAAPGDPGHLANLRNGRLELRHVCFRHPIQLLDAFVQVIDVVENLRQQSPLQRREDPIQRRHDFVQLGQETFVEQLGDLRSTPHLLNRSCVPVPPSCGRR